MAKRGRPRKDQVVRFEHQSPVIVGTGNKSKKRLLLHDIRRRHGFEDKTTWRAASHEMHHRLNTVATMMRRSFSTQEIQEYCRNSWNVTTSTANAYIKKVQKQFLEQCRPEKRIYMMVEHLMCLKESIREALGSKDYSSLERLLRQYGECIGIVSKEQSVFITQVGGVQQAKTALEKSLEENAIITLRNLTSLTEKQLEEQVLGYDNKTSDA